MTRAALAARTAAAGLLVALAVGLGAGPAAAHNVVVDTTPGTDATVSEAPAEVSVTFDDVVLSLGEDGASTIVQVTDADGDEHATGCPATQDRTVSVPVSLDDAGEYTVAWRIVSADGHPTSGEFSFAYSPSGGVDGASGDGSGTDGGSPTGAASGADCAAGGGSATEGSSEAAGSQEAGAQESGSDDLLVVLGIAGAVVLLAGGGVLVALRAGRRHD